jgi:crotonobetainyl-CoA:carnitine CoA-transferase CaiB-like acyl-CoA transferase
VREVEEVVADPEVAERAMLIESEYPTRGPIRVTGTPVKLSEVPDAQVPKRRPPELGEHTEEVLASIGIASDEVAQLRAQGVI